MGSLYFDADIDIKKLVQKVDQINTNLNRVAQQAANSGSILDKSFQSAGKSAGALGNDVGSLQRNLLGLASVATIGRLGQQIISIRGEFQQLGIAFEVMLGSKEKADKLMQDAVLFAQKTPFTLTDVATNIKQLLAMGIATDKVMETMKSLGNVAAGVSVPIARVAINYGQVATIGKLQGRELRDFAMAGIPLIDELAKNLGKAKSEITDMIEAGQIGFPMVEKAFQTMSGEGGKFFNLMEKQNKSVTGQISNLTDKLQVMFNEIGKSNEGLIYGGIAGLGAVVENYQDVLDILKVLIATYGAYRAALMLTTAAQGISTIATMAQEWMAMGKALGFATANQMLFNSSVLLNPYVAAAVGITALVTALVVFSDKAKTAEDYIKDLNSSMEQIGKQIELEGAIAKFDELNNIEKRTTEQQTELNKTIQKLSLIFPGAISETDKYGKAVGLVTDKLYAQNKALRDNIRAVNESQVIGGQKELNELIDERAKKLQEINSGKFTYSLGNGQSATAELTPEEIQKRRDQVIALSGTIDELGAKIQQSNEKLYDLNSIDASIALKPYQQLFKTVGEYTKKQALDAKAKLVGLLGDNLGGRAESQIINQLNLLDEYINKLKTTGKEEKEWKTQLAAAQLKLNEINKAGYESLDPAKDKADQEAIIKTLKDKLGIKKGEKKVVDELKVATEQLEAAVKAGDQSAIAAAARRITLLEKEKKSIQDIMDLELQRAWSSQFDGQSMAPIKSIGAKPITQVGSQKTVQGILYEVTAIDKTGPTWKKVKAQFSELKKFEKETNKKAADDQDELDEYNFEKKKRFQEDLLNYSRQFTDELISQLGLSDEQGKQMQGMADTLFNLASGNYLGAAFSAGSMLLDAVMGDNKVDPTVTALEKINTLLDRQSAILANMAGSNYFELAAKQAVDLGKAVDATMAVMTKRTSANYIVSQEDIDNLQAYTNAMFKESARVKIDRDNFKKYAEQVSFYNYQYNPPKDYSGYTPEQFIDEYAAGSLLLDTQQLEWVAEIINLQKQRAELLQETFREALGFDSSTVSDTIFQGIEDGLKLGENSLGGFAESFGELMKTALMQSVIDAMEMDITNTFLPKYKDAMQDGILSDAERKDLEGIYATLVKQGEIDAANIKTITDPYLGTSAAKQSGSTGISASASEETIVAMVGQTMAMRVDLKNIQTDLKIIQETGINALELMDQSLSALNNIDRNTRNLTRLESLETKLDTINETLKKNG